MDSPHPPRDQALIRKIFLSNDEPRLRAGWRILFHSGCYNLLLLCVSIPVFFPIYLRGRIPVNLWLSVAIQFFVVTPTVFIARRFLDHRTITSLGLKIDLRALLDLITGIVITFILMGVIFSFEYVVGWLTFDGFVWQNESISSVFLSILGMVLLFVLVSWNEELLFRGYRLQNLLDGLSPTWAVIISSAWFGLAHIANPNATWVAVVGILLAGIFMAFPVIRTGQLWLSLGMHIGWNFFEGPIFGFPVSGLNQFTLVKISIQGPAMFTGGPFGPEAGLILLPVLLLGLGLTWLFTRNRSKPITN